VFKRGGIWQTKIVINGKRRRVSLRTADKKMAKQVEHELKSQIELAHRDKKENGLTFEEYSRQWLSVKEVETKPSTMREYRSMVERLFIPEFKDQLLTQITAGQLVLFAARLKKEARRPKAATNKIALLKLMLRNAREWDHLKIDPAVDLKRAKNRTIEIEVLDPRELTLLIENVDTYYLPAFKTVALTGIRAGELWGLKWEDFQPALGKLSIRRSLWRGTLQTPKTSNGERVVDLPDGLVHDLKVWRLKCPPNPMNLMFPSPEGEPTEHQAVVRMLNRTLKKAGLKHVSFHSLRHTNASIRIKAGQPLQYIAKQLGHHSASFTLSVYGHLFINPEEQRQEANRLSGFLKIGPERDPLMGSGLSQVV
jgi:integrase